MSKVLKTDDAFTKELNAQIEALKTTKAYTDLSSDVAKGAKEGTLSEKAKANNLLEEYRKSTVELRNTCISKKESTTVAGETVENGYKKNHEAFFVKGQEKNINALVSGFRNISPKISTSYYDMFTEFCMKFIAPLFAAAFSKDIRSNAFQKFDTKLSNAVKEHTSEFAPEGEVVKPAATPTVAKASDVEEDEVDASANPKSKAKKEAPAPKAPVQPFTFAANRFFQEAKVVEATKEDAAPKI
ncbi:MAG: hypothetical protein QNK11_08835 [Legionella sp.]|nr:hypothetical protein [Legionella sp.]